MRSISASWQWPLLQEASFSYPDTDTDTNQGVWLLVLCSLLPPQAKLTGFESILHSCELPVNASHPWVPVFGFCLRLDGLSSLVILWPSWCYLHVLFPKKHALFQKPV